MHARSAKLPDAFAIEHLIQVHIGDGTLLPRPLSEICENIRDFTVVENEGETASGRDPLDHGDRQVERQGRGPDSN
jgi:N-acetylglutamate synthase-like GNAT family acetyltransferase